MKDEGDEGHEVEYVVGDAVIRLLFLPLQFPDGYPPLQDLPGDDVDPLALARLAAHLNVIVVQGIYCN